MYLFLLSMIFSFGKGKDDARGDISPRDAHTRASDGSAVIVDVRSPEEYAGGTAAGAKNIPLGEIPARLDFFREECAGKDILLLCRSGARSAQARDVLARADIPARNIAGGMIAWEKEGLPVA